MRVELRERTFGELIGLCFTLAIQHMHKLLPIAVLCGLPGLFLQLSQLAIDTADRRNVKADPSILISVVVFMVIMLLVYIVVFSLQQAASTLIISGSFTEKDYGIGESLRVGLRKAGPVLAYSLATGLIIGLGALLLLVPGLIFTTWFYVGVPAIVLEDMRAGEAMSRSRELSAGYRWSIFGFIFVMGFLVGIVTGTATTIVVAIVGKTVLSMIISWSIQVVGYVFASTAPVVYYFQLRVIKEALDVEKLSNLVSAIEERARASTV